MEIVCHKLHTGQSDYLIVLDNIKHSRREMLAQRMCARRTGLGADGAVFVNTANDALAKISAFNAQGGGAGLCESAARVCAELLYIKGIFKNDSAVISTDGCKCEIRRLSPSLLQTKATLPSFEPRKILPLKSDVPIINSCCEIRGGAVTLTAVFSGMPFAAVFVDNVDYVNIGERGDSFQNSRIFQAGINLAFIQIVNETCIKLRVFRHGVGEVPSCGSAAMAAVACAVRQGACARAEITVLFSGGALVCGINKGKMELTASAHYIAGFNMEVENDN